MLPKVSRRGLAALLAVAWLDVYGEGCFAAVPRVRDRMAQVDHRALELRHVYHGYRELEALPGVTVQWGNGREAHQVRLPEELRQEARAELRRRGLLRQPKQLELFPDEEAQRTEEPVAGGVADEPPAAVAGLRTGDLRGPGTGGDHAEAPGPGGGAATSDERPDEPPPVVEGLAGAAGVEDRTDPPLPGPPAPEPPAAPAVAPAAPTVLVDVLQKLGIAPTPAVLARARAAEPVCPAVREGEQCGGGRHWRSNVGGGPSWPCPAAPAPPPRAVQPPPAQPAALDKARWREAFEDRRRRAALGEALFLADAAAQEAKLDAGQLRAAGAAREKTWGGGGWLLPSAAALAALLVRR